MQERMKPHMTEQSLAGQNQTAQYNAGQWSLCVLLKTFPHFTRIYIFFVPFALEKTRFNEMQSILRCFLLVRGIANSWFSWLSVVVSHNASKYSRMSWAANFYVSFPCQKKEEKKKKGKKNSECSVQYLLNERLGFHLCLSIKWRNQNNPSSWTCPGLPFGDGWEVPLCVQEQTTAKIFPTNTNMEKESRLNKDIFKHANIFHILAGVDEAEPEWKFGEAR